jgi:carboxymethylenebutenolidase
LPGFFAYILFAWIFLAITKPPEGVQMQEQFVEIKTVEGMMEAFVTHPEENGPFPAVIIYMDIWGVREELYDIARRVGTVGYYCMVPDFYYRNGKRVHFEFRNENNQTISINRLEGQALREIQTRPKLSNKMVMDDTGAILKFLDGAERVRRGGVGAIGFCMGGRYVMGAAGTYPPGTFLRVGLIARDGAHLRSRRLPAPAGH